MNDNQKPKSFSALSEQLSEIFDHMDYIDSSFNRIEAYAGKKYQEIEKKINPDQNCDISKELQYHMANFLSNLAKNYETKKHNSN